MSDCLHDVLDCFTEVSDSYVLRLPMCLLSVVEPEFYHLLWAAPLAFGLRAWRLLVAVVVPYGPARRRLFGAVLQQPARRFSSLRGRVLR